MEPLEGLGFQAVFRFVSSLRTTDVSGILRGSAVLVPWITWSGRVMAKNQRKVNKANHGRRPASSKARKQKRKKLCF